MWGFFAPAKTSARLITRLRDEIVVVLNKPEVKDRLMASTTEVVGSTPEKFAAEIKADMERGSKVIKAAGIRAE